MDVHNIKFRCAPQECGFWLGCIWFWYWNHIAEITVKFCSRLIKNNFFSYDDLQVVSFFLKVQCGLKHKKSKEEKGKIRVSKGSILLLTDWMWFHLEWMLLKFQWKMDNNGNSTLPKFRSNCEESNFVRCTLSCSIREEQW
jgi:hypothetical protein